MKNTSRISLILALLAIPILLFGWLFIDQSLRDIAFSSKERTGIVALRSAVPLLHMLAGDHDQDSARIQALADELTRQISPDLQAEEPLKRLLYSMSLGENGHEASIEDARALIAHIGDTSNLILDPDIDSYYMMDIVVMRLPDILSKLNFEHSAVSALTNTTNETIELRSAALVDIGRIAVARVGMRNSFRKALGSALPLTTQKRLADAAADLDTALQGFEVAIRNRLLVNEKLASTNASKSDELLAKMASLSAKSFAVWRLAVDELDRLLADRIARFHQRLFVALAISVIVALIVVLVAIGLFRQMLSKMDGEIIFLARHDPLTRLLNRTSLSKAIDAEGLRSTETGSSFAVHLIDLDRFKSVNDSLGHGIGDGLIMAMGERLQTLAGTTHSVGRLGGDEFVVLQRDVSEEELAQDFADRIVELMRDPFMIKGHTINATSSVGTALAPRHGSTSEELLICADLALYAAKGSGRNRARFFSLELEREATERQRIEGELRAAVQRDGFDIDFQAQYDVTGASLRGFEALVRLSDTTGRRISPGVFVPIAENLGLINAIGTLVLVKSCVLAARWPEHLSVAVNLSPIQFRDGKLPRLIGLALHKSGLAAERLTVEITEGLLLDKSGSVDQQLAEIRALGVKIAIDDFGSGYSNLAYLVKYRFDKIKIDRSFILALDDGSGPGKDIIRTIISLGRVMGMTVVAEGIETRQQAALMAELSCDEIQGYVYGRPVPAIDVADIILKDFNARVAHKEGNVLPLNRLSA